jgi:hypothetical protein
MCPEHTELEFASGGHVTVTAQTRRHESRVGPTVDSDASDSQLHQDDQLHQDSLELSYTLTRKSITSHGRHCHSG